MSEDYRIHLDIYNGPIDLLLYLIRKEEVDIYDIPIAKIADQYVEYVKVLHDMDPNLAGEFLVLAATLMEIKSRMLLPTPTDQNEAGEPIDPRSELVRQLLEYKRFKDAAGWLADAADTQSMKYPRIPALPELAKDDLDMEDIHIWDLVEAFSKLLQATLAGVGLHQVEKDDTPLALHQDDILDRLTREGPMPFSRIFEGKTRKTEMIGLFLAMLELMRQGLIRIEQDQPFAEIYLFLKVDLPQDPSRPTEENEHPDFGEREPQQTPASLEAESSDAATMDSSASVEPEYPPPAAIPLDEDDDEEDEEIDDLGDLGLDDLSHNEKLWRQADEPNEEETE
jgi:segregation and condensation protein A